MRIHTQITYWNKKRDGELYLTNKLEKEQLIKTMKALRRNRHAWASIMKAGDEIGKKHPEQIQSVMSDGREDTNVATEEKITNIIEELLAEAEQHLQTTGSPETEYWVWVAVGNLLQAGGTSPNKPGTSLSRIGTTNTYMTLNDLREACARQQVTVRAFARGVGTRIAHINLRYRRE